MERKEQSPPSGPPQAAKGEDDQSSEEKRAMVALARILGAGPLVGGSLRLLEQLADYVQCPQEGVPRETAPAKQAAAQLATSAGEGSVETEPTEVPMGEPSYSGDPEHTTEEGVIVGSLRTMPTDRWTCKVPACSGKFHRLKDCRRFHKMEPEERLRLVDLHGLCLGCLTPGHGRAARNCPYEEERADACKKAACRRRHHQLLHVEEHKAKKGPEKDSVVRPPSPHEDPTPTEDLGCEVQLVAQWVSTKGGAPALIFWDTGSQVTLVTQKMANTLGLTAIPSSPLIAGDTRHPEDGQHPGLNGHPQLAVETRGNRRGSPPASSDALQGPAG